MDKKGGEGMMLVEAEVQSPSDLGPFAMILIQPCSYCKLRDPHGENINCMFDYDVQDVVPHQGSVWLIPLAALPGSFPLT